MKKSKIKNFIILLLALVNVFLLIIVVSNAGEAAASRNYRKQAMVEVLSANGIAFNMKGDLPEAVPKEIYLRRDLKNEKKLISALIGDCSAEDQGGNIILYLGEKGQAGFYGTGYFKISLDGIVIPKGNDAVSSAKSALKRLGISPSNAPPRVRENGDTTNVTISCAYDGCQVYNSEVTFSFNSQRLVIIEGTRPLDTEYSSKAYQKYPDSVTVLMSFLRSIGQTGEVCSEIKDMKLAYSMEIAVSGDCSLRPVWDISTDVGSYYVDALTGKPEKKESVRPTDDK
ncbi:MAG: hypothetical protein RSD32_08375 [Oscillospiraceae bacterium]